MKSIVYIFKIIMEWVIEIFYFPFWWYFGGLSWLIKKMANYLADEFSALAIFIWLKNLFVPMYGQRNIAGFIISIFMRLVQIIFRTIYWLILVFFCLVLLFVWLALPIIIALGFYMQIMNYEK